MGALISLISAAFSNLVNEWFPTATEVQATVQIHGVSFRLDPNCF